MSRWLRTHPMIVLLIPLAVSIGLFDYFLPSSMPSSLMYDSIAVYEVVLTDYPVARKNSWRCEAGNVYIYLQADSANLPQLGDTLWVRTYWQRPGMLGDFDYGKYLQRQGIYAIGFVHTGDWKIVGAGHIPWYNPRYLQHLLVERFRTLGISGDELATLSALSLGYRENLDDDLKRSFSKAGAMHVLAVSGLHTGVLWVVLTALLTFFGLRKPLYEERCKRILLASTITAMMWCYAALTGWSPSVVRSVIMISVVEVGVMLYERGNTLNTIAAAAVLILLWHPSDLFSVGFQLSFAAVTAIVLFNPILEEFLPPTRNKVLNFFEQLIITSLSAQLGTLPLTLHYFSQTSNYFLITNILVLPLATAVMVGALAVLTIGWITPIGTCLSFLLKWLVWLMNTSVAWVEHLPGSTAFMHCSWLMTLLLYGAIVCGALSLSMHNTKRAISCYVGTAMCLIVFCLLYSF